MKKIIALVLALIMLFSFASCVFNSEDVQYNICVSYKKKLFKINALSSSLAFTQRPVKVMYSVENKAFDSTKEYGVGNSPYFLAERYIASFDELNSIESSIDCVYPTYKEYFGLEGYDGASALIMRYYFRGLDFDDLVEIIDNYFRQSTFYSVEYLRQLENSDLVIGSDSSVQRDMAKKTNFKILYSPGLTFIVKYTCDEYCYFNFGVEKDDFGDYYIYVYIVGYDINTPDPYAN